MENLFDMRMEPARVKEVTNLGLAHIGDGVYELLVRSYLVSKGGKTVLKLHNETVNLVKAPTQAKFADKLKPILTEEEMDYFRRGKNAHTHAAPRSATPQEYAKATGFETLFGALYLLGRKDRLMELFAVCMEAD